MKRILIVGAGFAAMHAALSAARLRDAQGVSPDTLEIAVVAPEPRLVVRPRLYERAPETMVAPLAELFVALDIRFEQGRVDVIDSASKSVVIVELIDGEAVLGKAWDVRLGPLTAGRQHQAVVGQRAPHPVRPDDHG